MSAERSAFVLSSGQRVLSSKPRTIEWNARSLVQRRPPPSRPRAARAPSMVWVERAASVVVENPARETYDVYVDLQTMPRWSPWLRRVEVDPEDPYLSRWVLGARGLEFSWLARIVEHERGRIIRWVSETGLNNRGRVDFDILDPQETRVTLAIEFNVPELVAKAVRNDFIGKFVENTLQEDLKRFRNLVLAEKRKQRVSRRPSPIQ